jgi:hypothetical protein
VRLGKYCPGRHLVECRAGGVEQAQRRAAGSHLESLHRSRADVLHLERVRGVLEGVDRALEPADVLGFGRLHGSLRRDERDPDAQLCGRHGEQSSSVGVSSWASN